jgi:hypothetical protein
MVQKFSENSIPGTELTVELDWWSSGAPIHIWRTEQAAKAECPQCEVPSRTASQNAQLILTPRQEIGRERRYLQ